MSTEIVANLNHVSSSILTAGSKIGTEIELTHYSPVQQAEQDIENNHSSNNRDDNALSKTLKTVLPAINTVPLTGLRAIASIHIMLEHYIMFVTAHSDFMGGTTVVLFLVLSGFILSIAYGNRNLSNWRFRNSFAKEFYVKRLARLLPVYYVGLLFSIGMAILYYKISSVSIVLSVLNLSIWVFYYPWDGPLWTIQLLTFCYLVFPYILPFVKRYKRRIYWTNIFYGLSIFLYFFLFIIGLIIHVDPYYIARSFPPTRLTVFIIGMLMGLERLDPQTVNGILVEEHSGCDSQGSCCDCQCYYKCLNHGKSISIISNFYLVFFAFLIFICGYTTTVYGSDWSILRILFEAFVPLPYAYWMYVLTNPSANEDWFAKNILSHWILKEIAELSLGIYAFHFPVIQYIGWMLYGPSSIIKEGPVGNRNTLGYIRLPFWNEKTSSTECSFDHQSAIRTTSKDNQMPISSINSASDNFELRGVNLLLFQSIRDVAIARNNSPKYWTISRIAVFLIGNHEGL
eukprot:gene11951-15996_t